MTTPYLTVSELAKLVELTPQTVLAHIKAKCLKADRLPRTNGYSIAPKDAVKWASAYPKKNISHILNTHETRQRNELLTALQGTVKFRNWQLAEGGITPVDLLDVWKNAEAAIAKAKGAA